MGNVVEFKTIPINENSWRIEDTFVRAFFFKGRDKCLLVDSNNGPGDLKSITDFLSDGLPVLLINTHGDADHIGCNEQYEKTYMHPSEFAYYANQSKPGDAVPVPILEGEKIDLGGMVFEIILLPGHTCGSIALLNRNQRFLICGDTVSDYVFVFGMHRNLRALVNSLEKLVVQYADAFDVLYVSHGDTFIKDKVFIQEELICAKAHLNGELTGIDPGPIPLEPPDFRPAALFKMGNSGIFDYAE